LVVSSIGTHAINQLINPNIRYDTRRDFTHIALIARTSNALLASPAFRGRSVMDAIAQAKTNPKSINFAITGYGSSGHISMELFKQAANVDLTEVPYKGDSAAINDMLGGQVDLMFVNYAAAIPIVKSGKLRALAVTGASRSALLPDVSTMGELGLDVIVDTWIGLAGPANLPATISARLNRAVNDILSMPEIKDRLAASGTTAIPSTVREATAYVNSEVAKWSQVVKRANIHVE
jgi:tripartite-type tricarboxylate transporter receptor subunit TctC